MQRQTTFGGGVSPRNTRLRGQSIIEYVLIIAVIGLVIVFAGPGVAGAIRNQFNQVTNTVDSGTEGDSFMSAEEKAYKEAMKAITAKEAKDWTLYEQKAAATDIAKNGTSSVVYSKAKAAMDSGTTWQVKLTNGETMTYRIIGIGHDDLADGSGKAGLTLQTVNSALGMAMINSTATSVGGWEKSAIRERLNNGDFWGLLPSELSAGIKLVSKATDNTGDGKTGDPSITNDRMFLISSTEIYGDIDADGSQYELFRSKGVNKENHRSAMMSGAYWTRSTDKSCWCHFRLVFPNGKANPCAADREYWFFPCWCF